MSNLVLTSMILFLFVGCGKPKVSITGPGTNLGPAGSEARIEFYVNEFKKKAVEHNYYVDLDQVKIQMVDTLGERTLGTCSGKGGFAVVSISKSYWDKLSNASREELIFHELGHCALFRGHRTEVQSGNNVPLSIMNPFHLGASKYKANYEHYVYELFHRRDLASALPLKSSISSSFASRVDFLSSDEEVESGEDNREPLFVNCNNGHMVEAE